MNWSKVSVAALIGGVVYFFVGWGVHGMMLMELTALPAEIRPTVEMPMEQFKMSYMIISCLLVGLMLAMILRYAGVTTPLGGMRVAVPFAILFTFSAQLALASMYKWLDLGQIAIAAVGDAVCYALTGAVIGWYYGRDKS